MIDTYIKTKPKAIFNVASIVTIHYYEFGPAFSFKGEQHDFWEIVYIDKGRVQIQRDTETLILKQGEILFHSPNEFHSIRALDSAPNIFVISFNCTSSAMSYFVRYQTSLDATLKTYLSSIIKEAEKTYIIPHNNPDLKKLKRKSDGLIGGEQLIKTYLEQFLIFLLRSMINTPASSLPQKASQEDPLVNQIKEYLLLHVDKTIRVGDLCREFDYSRSYLSSHFYRHTGQTIMEYSTNLKMNEAKRLIRETDLNITQVSAKLSFDNPQYFSRVFKRKTGMTPTEFKNRAHIR